MAEASYDEQTALIVVDVQNDFADAEGSLYVGEGEQVVPVINREIDRAKAAGAHVIYTMDWHPESTPHFAKDGGIWPVHCVHDTWGAAFHPDLVVVDGPVVHKGVRGEDGYSGFTTRDPVTGDTVPTELPRLLEEFGIRRVVVVGLATDYCVLSTVIHARERELETTLLADAIRAVDLEPGDGDRAIDQMRAAGAVVVSP
jgi:nicotinamidase/pyrazinamidase